MMSHDQGDDAASTPSPKPEPDRPEAAAAEAPAPAPAPARRTVITARRRSFVRLVEHLQQELLTAYEEERVRHRLTRKKMADLLGCDKQALARHLNITSNMTLETLADLAYALNRPVRISLPSRDAMLRPGDNRRAPPPPHLSMSVGATPVETPSYAEESQSDPQAQPQIVIVMRSL